MSARGTHLHLPFDEAGDVLLAVEDGQGVQQVLLQPVPVLLHLLQRRPWCSRRDTGLRDKSHDTNLCLWNFSILGSHILDQSASCPGRHPHWSPHRDLDTCPKAMPAGLPWGMLSGRPASLMCGIPMASTQMTKISEIMVLVQGGSPTQQREPHTHSFPLRMSASERHCHLQQAWLNTTSRLPALPSKYIKKRLQPWPAAQELEHSWSRARAWVPVHSLP